AQQREEPGRILLVGRREKRHPHRGRGRRVLGLRVHAGIVPARGTGPIAPSPAMAPKTKPRTDRLTVAVLEPGRENSGIRRYSEIVSAGLAGLGDITPFGVAFTPRQRGWRGVLDAVTVLRGARHAD